MKIARWLLILAALLLLVPLYAQDSQMLTVFAAASLTDAFEEIATEFEAANPGVDVVFNFGGSAQLATQLSEGAPADVFASANLQQMRAAQAAGRIAGTPRIFVRNRLALALPADNPASLQTLADLANPGVKLVLAAPDVPVRQYTDMLLAKLSADPAYGADFADKVFANVVSEEPNVRQVVAKLALGEADAGIVYTSDVTPDVADQVTTIAIPTESNVIAVYPIAITDQPAQEELARAFVRYVLSDDGQCTLAAWGFVPGRPRQVC